MTRPLLLDLFCGAGGAAMGYHRAGFDVVGVDNRPQPNYPFSFVQHDALKLLVGDFAVHRIDCDLAEDCTCVARSVDVIHASPPCQAHIGGLRAMNSVIGRTDSHVDLIGPTRELLVQTGLPYVIENVVGAPLLEPVRLCGSSLGLPIHRHRLFESNVTLMVPPCAHGWQWEQKYWNGDRSERNADGTRSYTGHGRLSSVVQIYGHAGGRDKWPEALEIDWMTEAEMIDAIPPVFTELLGHQLLQHLRMAA